MESLNVFENNLLTCKKTNRSALKTRDMFTMPSMSRLNVTHLFYLRYDILIVCNRHKNQEFLKDFEKSSARIQYISLLISEIYDEAKFCFVIIVFY